ncbi:MAG: VOC family protein [Dehalococcoidia bacterium]|nr:VOC family protein [Dehalococcoidia bacterium]
MLKSFFHTGFVVKDLETSVAFYRDVMGLNHEFSSERTGEFAERVVGFKNAHLRIAFLNMENGHHLELVQYIVPEGAQAKFERNDLGASHLAFFVENMEEYHAAMSGRGLRFIGPPATLVENGKVMRKAAYAQDPDGNWLEFVELF